MKILPHRPIAGGTNNDTRPARYSYWRSGQSAQAPPGLAFYVSMAGEFHSKPNYLVSGEEFPHTTRIIYQIEGTARFESEEGKWEIRAGHLIFIPPWTVFSYTAAGSVKHHWVSLEGEWPPVLGQPNLRHVALAFHQDINATFVQLRENLILRRPGYHLMAISNFYELLGHLERASSEIMVESTYPETVRNALVYLKENCAAPFSAATTAAMVGLSQSHLRALFEKWLGESPKQYHTRCRIEEAQRLLRGQNLRVAEVAFQLGFQDAAHFSRIFKQVTGLSPNSYAKQSLSD